MELTQKETVGQSAVINKPTRSSKNGRLICIAVVAIALLAVGTCLALINRPFDENKNVNTKEYQAVFLTNGQVYFGKISDLNHKYISVTDIYYLQVQQGTVTSDSLQNGSGKSDNSSQISLAKLGNELHGPEDKMSVASDQVLFWENMKNDSKVSKAITEYRKSR